MAAIGASRASDPWDQPSVASFSQAASRSNILRRPVPTQPIPDDWDNDEDEGELEDNQKIWEDANARAPMPELVISSSSATAASTPIPPATIFQPMMRILKRPSASTDSSAGSISSQTPTETLAEREVRYQAARERIFGASAEKDNRRSGGGGDKGKKGVAPTASVNVVRNPTGPSEGANDGQASKGFKRRSIRNPGPLPLTEA